MPWEAKEVEKSRQEEEERNGREKEGTDETRKEVEREKKNE